MMRESCIGQIWTPEKGESRLITHISLYPWDVYWIAIPSLSTGHENYGELMRWADKNCAVLSWADGPVKTYEPIILEVIERLSRGNINLADACRSSQIDIEFFYKMVGKYDITKILERQERRNYWLNSRAKQDKLRQMLAVQASYSVI